RVRDQDSFGDADQDDDGTVALAGELPHLRLQVPGVELQSLLGILELTVHLSELLERREQQLDDLLLVGSDDEMSCAYPQIDLDLELTPLPKLQLLEDPVDPLQEMGILERLGDEVVRPQREALQ